MNLFYRATAVVLLALVAGPQALANCGATFCAINTNWDAHGAWGEPGLRFDLRYERIVQDQLLAGRTKVATGALPRDHDEVRTLNRNWLASIEYTINQDWGASVTVPIVSREHAHIENDFASGVRTPESWKFTGAGDARVMARYRVATLEGRAPSLAVSGINFGLKLPTGRIDARNADGARAERPLQPGSGTTDALFGAYYAQTFPMNDLSWFVQALAQLPLDQREAFRPGRRLSLDSGLRYDGSETVSLMLQLNGLYRGRDAGPNAEPEDSGGRSWFLSPGASVAITQDVRLYGFLQMPLYQYVNGVQLAARRTAVLGLSVRF